MKGAPSRNHREGISLLELARRFPDEAAARAWFEDRSYRRKQEGNMNSRMSDSSEVQPEASSTPRTARIIGRYREGVNPTFETEDDILWDLRLLGVCLISYFGETLSISDEERETLNAVYELLGDMWKVPPYGCDQTE